jgi:hypothetical protein
LIVEASKEADIIWRVAIYAPGNPVAYLATSTAVQLSNYLRKNGDKELARRIVTAVEEARRNTRNASSHATEIGALHIAAFVVGGDAVRIRPEHPQPARASHMKRT